MSREISEAHFEEGIEFLERQQHPLLIDLGNFNSPPMSRCFLSGYDGRGQAHLQGLLALASTIARSMSVFGILGIQ